MEGKALRIRHIAILDDYNLPYEDYLFVKKDADSYTFINKKTGKIISLRRWKDGGYINN